MVDMCVKCKRELEKPIIGEDGSFYCELCFYDTEQYKKMSEREKESFLRLLMSRDSKRG